MDAFQIQFHDFHKLNIQKPHIWTSNFWAPISSTLRKAEDLMPRDIMSSEPRHWMVFGQLAMPVQCCAEARWRALHCTGMTNWPNTIQCLGSDDIMSLDTKSYPSLLPLRRWSLNLSPLSAVRASWFLSHVLASWVSGHRGSTSKSALDQHFPRE